MWEWLMSTYACTCTLHMLHLCPPCIEIKKPATDAIPPSSSSDSNLFLPKHPSRSTDYDPQHLYPLQSFHSSTYPMSSMYGGKYSSPEFMFRSRMPKDGEDMSDRWSSHSNVDSAISVRYIHACISSKLCIYFCRVYGI